jgi:hypothetical protein
MYDFNNTYAGMRVHISHPTTKIVQRTWWERIRFQPWQNEKTVIIPAAVPTDECYRVGNNLYCGEKFYEELKAATVEQPLKKNPGHF